MLGIVSSFRPQPLASIFRSIPYSLTILSLDKSELLTALLNRPLNTYIDTQIEHQGRSEDSNTTQINEIKDTMV
jgi:hypothetical protein